MTSEEAIEELEKLKRYVEPRFYRDGYLVALDMAIEALSAKPTDLISRVDAIEAIESRQTEQWIDTDVDYNNGLESAVSEIKALPSADRPQGEWKHTITMQPYCSNCEYVFGEDEEFSPFWNYCPMCGARIKGGDSE